MKRKVLNKKYLYILIIVFLSIINCNKINDVYKKISILPNSRFEIENNELPQIEKEALSGSPEAAFKLYQHYELWADDNEKSYYWLKIAAQNNHPIAQYNLAYKLIEDSDPNIRLKGLYLAKKMIQKGDKNAVNLIEYYKFIEKEMKEK